ncbi:hypothetical protein ABZ858_26590 [Streptomyces sp. NPDC047017]
MTATAGSWTTEAGVGTGAAHYAEAGAGAAHDAEAGRDGCRLPTR